MSTAPIRTPAVESILKGVGLLAFDIDENINYGARGVA